MGDRTENKHVRPVFASARARKVLAMIDSDYRDTVLNILDLGCCNGILRDIANENYVYGADICSKFFSEALMNGYMDCAVINLEQEMLPFPRVAFDMVVLGECIEHVADTDFLLSNINDRLPASGDLILTFPNLRTPIGLLMYLLNRVPMFGAGYRSAHVKDFTTSSMRTALKNNGFRVVEMIGTTFCVSSHPDGILSWLATFFPSWSSQVVVHAVKNGISSRDRK